MISGKIAYLVSVFKCGFLILCTWEGPKSPIWGLLCRYVAWVDNCAAPIGSKGDTIIKPPPQDSAANWGLRPGLACSARSMPDAVDVVYIEITKQKCIILFC